MRQFPVKYLLLAFILYGCFTRVVQLDKRAFHHDESQHATFSLNWHENPTTNYYKFQPAYHGPVLYYLTSKVYAWFGVGVHQARLLPLVFGLFLIFGLFLWSGYLGHWPTWIAATLMSMSPIMGYFSTFIVHDFLCLSLIFVIVNFVFKFLNDDRSLHWTDFLFLGTAFGVLNAAKLIGLIYLVLMLGYVIFYLVLSKREIKIHKPQNILLSFGAFFVSFLLFYVFFQSSALKNLNAAWNGLLGENLVYWWNQHSVARIKGSIWYHLRNLVLYETLLSVFLFAVIGLYLKAFLTKAKMGLRFAVFVALGVLVCLALGMYSPAKYFSVFKLTSHEHILIYVLCAVSGLFIAGIEFRLSKIRSFLWYMFGSNLAVFSYIGEKVPWLSVYIVFFAILLVSQYIPAIMKKALAQKQYGYFKIIALVFLVLLQVRIFHKVSYETAGTGRDLLDQVHNSQYPRYFASMLANSPTTEKKHNILAVGSELSWGMFFYLKIAKNIQWSGAVSGFNGKQDFLFLDEAAKNKLTKKNPLENYHMKTYSMSRWWTPYYMKMNFREWFHYFWHRTLQKGFGERKFFMYYKKGLEQKYNFEPSEQTLLDNRRVIDE